MAKRVRRKKSGQKAAIPTYREEGVKASRPDTRPALIALFLVILLIGSALYFTSMVEDSSAVVEYGVNAEVLTNNHNTEPGQDTDFVLVVTNKGSIADTFDVGVKSNDGGFTITIEEGYESIVVDKNKGKPVIINVKTSSSATGLLYAYLEVKSRGDGTKTAEVRLDVNTDHEFGNKTSRGDSVSVEYAGILARNANLFDSSMGQVWENYQYLKSGVEPRADTGNLQAANIGCDGNGIPTEECGGSRQMIPGFDAKMVGMHEGQILAVRIPAKDAYGVDSNGHNLGGEDLIFVIDMVSID
tara:strand:+ start:1006 stop:1905 length:900 start_codon:yes stop_codon:yes gene_type:complete